MIGILQDKSTQYWAGPSVIHPMYCVFITLHYIIVLIWHLLNTFGIELYYCQVWTQHMQSHLYLKPNLLIPCCPGDRAV